MAARRLLVLLLVLFGFSTLAAALIPVPPPAERSTSTEGETETQHAGPRLLERTIDAAGRRPSRIRLREGDFLGLTVRARHVTQVEIPRLGVLEDVGPYDSATLDLAPPEAGTYAVRLADRGRVIARVRVATSANGCCRRG